MRTPAPRAGFPFRFSNFICASFSSYYARGGACTLRAAVLASFRGRSGEFSKNGGPKPARRATIDGPHHRSDSIRVLNEGAGDVTGWNKCCWWNRCKQLFCSVVCALAGRLDGNYPVFKRFRPLWFVLPVSGHSPLGKRRFSRCKMSVRLWILERVS